MRTPPRVSLAGGIWLLLVLLAGVLVARARYSADLSAFLPSSPTATQRLLVDQLREGLTSRLILGQISGGDEAARAAVSKNMAAQLKDDPRFLAFSNGDAATTQADQRYLMEHRYLLSEAVTPEHFSVGGLKAALEDTLDLLTSPAGMLAKGLLSRDPTGEMVEIIGSLSGGVTPRNVSGVWSSRDGNHALLLAQTKAQGSDTDGQQQAVEALQAAFARAKAAQTQPLTLKLTGTPVFSVEARARIKSQALRLSVLSSALVITLLLVVYRSLPALAVGLVPVVTGALAGIAAVSLGFGSVHGVTLGFGITLIGEVVDYSIYLFIQARERRESAHWLKTVWPTIRLGVLTSLAGFASLLASGFPGLTQLGVYSIAGLLAGAAVTRFVLPAWLPKGAVIRDLVPLGKSILDLLPRLHQAQAWLLVIPLAGAAILYTHRDTLLNRELSALSPVSQADLALNERIQGDLGAVGSGSLVALTGPSQESVLRAAQALAAKLEELTEKGVIGGFTSPASYLPSQATQEARRASLPEAKELKERLDQALAGMPLSASRLGPFLEDVEEARQAPLITEKDLQGTSLSAAVQALLFETGGSWHALLPLKPPFSGNDTGDIDLRVVRQALQQAPGSPLVLGVKAETNRLYGTYLRRAVTYSLAGLGAIILLLALALRQPARVARVVTPLLLAVLAVASGLVLAGKALTILHVMGMLLIVAVGSNYALFFDSRATAAHQGHLLPLTLASLLIANLATVLTFGVLAFSSVPVLASLGQTVAPGTLLSLLFSAVLARPMSGDEFCRVAEDEVCRT